MTLAGIKAAARDAAYARRKAAFAARGSEDARRLLEVLGSHAGKALSGYMPMRTEIDCLPAMATHRGPVGVPVILGPGQALRFRAWSPGAEMVPGTFGALVPAEGDWIEPEVLIVPLLAFDRRGYRLGYGGGFYDRTLEALRARGPVTAIGFAFAAQEVDEVPIEATDQPLDIVVTDKGILIPGG
ncbi:MAG: 5-formyltetrahydrofolate cyclo-ligase [Defluviimonas sp.]|nr:5-formyltetrahydrofolate cyclo-ligase [Paracoccaceae bacterium]MCC0063704.1 5-formyltetrahydrofolate cyclo-ligase [Defluviimonas sp.]